MFSWKTFQLFVRKFYKTITLWHESFQCKTKYFINDSLEENIYLTGLMIPLSDYSRFLINFHSTSTHQSDISLSGGTIYIHRSVHIVECLFPCTHNNYFHLHNKYLRNFSVRPWLLIVDCTSESVAQFCLMHLTVFSKVKLMRGKSIA